jgi:hypothetical protein
MIRLTIFGNFFVLYVCICIIHQFSVRIQLWQWLCHPETKFLKYMIWSSSSIIFQCKFSCDSDYVIWRPYFWNIWYGHHQASFFSANSAVIVIMSSGDNIFEIMIWSSSDIIFQCEFSHDSDYIIRRLYFKILNVKTKIQDKEAHLSWDNIKAKIQDKELQLKSMSRPKSKIKKSTWDNVKAKI